jgi:hypothetical protein
MSTENTGNTVAPETATDESQEEIVETEGEASPEQEASPEGDKAQAKPAEQKKIEAALKAYELQVNGKSKKIELDITNDAEVKKYLQKAMAADEKFEEAAMTRKQAEQLVEKLQKDPLSILRNPALGLNIRELAEKILLQDLEEQAKSPEQKELEEARRKLQAYEEEKARLEEERKQAIMQQKQSENQKQIEDSMIAALEQSDLPATPFTVRRVADIMVSAIESGWEDVTIEQIMPYAQEVILNEMRETARKHKGSSDKLDKLFGKDVFDDYRKEKVSKAKKAPTTASQLGQSTAKSEKKEEAPVKKTKISDFTPW